MSFRPIGMWQSARGNVVAFDRDTSPKVHAVHELRAPKSAGLYSYWTV